jgi:hypothetical protein
MTDTLTLWIWLGVWPVLGAWELVLLVLRWRGRKVRTISMVAKDRGPHLTSIVYAWTAIPAHWWWNAPRWGPDWLAVAFWVIPVALLGWDIWTWREDAASWPRWKRWTRHPLPWMAAGLLAGRFLFPQAAA